MTQPLFCSVNTDMLTLSINDQLHTYPNDKAGKRQAILDGLDAISTTTIGSDTYMPSREALQLVAMVMFPAGIHTDDAYRLVCSVTDKACTHLGYGPEVDLVPPTVPFSARGPYRKRFPPVDTQAILAELNLARTSTTLPQQEMVATILWNQAGYDIYGRHWQELTLSEQINIQTQIDAIAEAAGWQKEQRSIRDIYTKKMQIDEENARRRLAEMLQRENGRPVLRSGVLYQVQQGAYGRSFLNNEFSPDLQKLAVEVLSAHGYDPESKNGEYWPQPLALNLPPVESLQIQLASLVPIEG